MRTIVVLILTAVLVFPVSEARAQSAGPPPLADEAWVYASRLDLTCPDVATCYKTEGKEVRWFHRTKTFVFGRAHKDNAAELAREAVPVQLESEGMSLIDADTNDRLLYGEGRRIWIAYVYPLSANQTCGSSNMTFSYEEKSRPTALMAGLNAILAATVPQKEATVTKADEPISVNACIDFQRKVLKNKRATAKMTYTGPTTGKEAPQSAHTVITGPMEHMFFSGDVIVRKVTELKFDKGTGTLSEKDKPERVYLGFNYQIGDVYSHANALSIDRLVAKAMITAGKKPLDSVGVGVGYQIQDFLFPTGGTTGGAFQIYGGHYWTKGDAGPRKKEWRFGLSFNIDTLVGWVKPKSDK